MATRAKSKKKVGSKRSSGQGLAPMMGRLRREARDLVSKNRSDVQKSLTRLQKQVLVQAQRTIRDLETRLLKRLHAASENQVKQLERRVARLEKLVAEESSASRRVAAAM